MTDPADYGDERERTPAQLAEERLRRSAPGDPHCANCGNRLSKHLPLSPSRGGVPFWICPSAVFRDKEE